MRTKNKVVIVIFLSTILAVLISSLSSAVFWACFNYQQKIDFCNPNTPDRTCSSEMGCSYCMSTYDETRDCYNQGSINSCNALGGAECQYFGNSSNIDILPPNITLRSPIQEGIYKSRAINFDLSLNERSDVSYTDIVNGRGRWTNICNDCFSMNRTRSFKDGYNQLMLKAKDRVGNTAYKNISFYIDSRKPRVTKIDPRSGFTSGFFDVWFIEENPVNVTLYYEGSSLSSSNIALNQCEKLPGTRDKYTCSHFVNLSNYNNQEVSFWVDVTDIANAVSSSRIVELNLDTKPPIINSLNYTRMGRRILFTINITELNFDKATYIDNSASRPKERILCSSLKNGICSKSITLNSFPAQHDIDIIVRDEAGNSAERNILITV